MNTTQTKHHTALPWRLQRGFQDRKLYILTGFKSDKPFCGQVIWHETTCPDSEANAEFIVRACNSHYELLRVAKEMTMLAEALLERLPDEPRNRDCYKRTIAAANAIALAERGQE